MFPKKIKFVKNWNNKLDCVFFSTIRKADYPLQTADIAEVWLGDKKIKDVRVMYTEVMPFRDLNWATLAGDTGLFFEPAVEVFRRFGINPETDNVKVLLLKTI